MKQKMKVQLFGNFYLSDDRTVIDEAGLHSKKIITILAYFLLNRDRAVTHEELTGIMWGKSSRNPSGALKNLIYRLQSELLIFGETEYILTESKVYRWNPEIPVETDYDRLLQLEVQVQKTELTKDELEHVSDIILKEFAYDISFFLDGEAWLISECEKYKALYRKILRELCAACDRAKAWILLEQLCVRALEADYSDEDMHCWMMRSLQGQQKCTEAVQHYETASSFLLDKTGNRNYGKLELTLHEIVSSSQKPADSMAEVLEKLAEKGSQNGAFFCTWQVFRNIYQIEARRIGRCGIAEYVLLLTVRHTGRVRPQWEAGPNVLEGMAILEEVVCRSCCSTKKSCAGRGEHAVQWM